MEICYVQTEHSNSKGLNSESNSWAGGGGLLCPTHVLIFYCFIMCILQHFELLDTFRFRLTPQQCSLIAFVIASVYYWDCQNWT